MSGLGLRSTLQTESGPQTWRNTLHTSPSKGSYRIARAAMEAGGRGVGGGDVLGC